MNRKGFIQKGSLAAALLTLGEMDVLAGTNTPAASNKGTDLLVLATNWGFEGTVQQFCEAVAKAGYAI